MTLLVQSKKGGVLDTGHRHRPTSVNFSFLVSVKVSVLPKQVSPKKKDDRDSNDMTPHTGSSRPTFNYMTAKRH